jgi:hypothetical protein
MAKEKRFTWADSLLDASEPFVSNQVIPNLRPSSPKQSQAPFHEQDTNKMPCFLHAGQSSQIQPNQA